MKKFIEFLTKHPYWVFITVLISALNGITSIIKNVGGSNKNIMSMLQFLANVDLGSLCAHLIIAIFVYALVVRYNAMKAEIDKIKTDVSHEHEKIKKELAEIRENAHKGRMLIGKEIVNNVYIKIIRLNYRTDCLLKNETYDAQKEKALVEGYLRSDKQGLTVQEMNEILNKHFSE